MRTRTATALAVATMLVAGIARAQDQEGTRLSLALEQLRETVLDRLNAAADKLGNELLGDALDQWEAEDGPFTADELSDAASRLGLAPSRDVA